MALIKLLDLMRRQGVRRRTIKLKPIKAAMADKGNLRAIGNEMASTVFAHIPALLEAAKPTRNIGDAVKIEDTSSDINQILQLIVTQTQQVMARLEFRISAWGKRVEDRHRQQFVSSVYDRTKVDLSTILHPSQTDQKVEHYITWASSLIRDIGDEARKRISGAVLEAVRNATSPRELAKTIREFEDMSYRRAKNIAADQTQKLNAALDRARQQEVGITHFTWIHSGAQHPREWHEERDGEVFAWDDNDIDPGDYPGEPPFCGCVAQATLIDDEGNATDTSQEIDAGEE